MDHRDDITLYQTLRDANAAARTDTWQRGKRVLRAFRAIHAWSVKVLSKAVRGTRRDR
jgi:hypothetical protein